MLQKKYGPEVEAFCRQMCHTEDMIPDDFSVGLGVAVEEGLEFRLWQYWIPHAIAYLSNNNP